MYVSLKLMGVVAFILVFSYVASGIIFMGGDIQFESINIDTKIESENSSVYYSYSQYIEINFQIFKELFYNGQNYELSETYQLYKDQFVFDMYGAFLHFGQLYFECLIPPGLVSSGLEYIERCMTDFPGSSITRGTFLNDYYAYLHFIGVDPSQIDLTETSNIPMRKGLGGIQDLLTFDFKDQNGLPTIPSEVRLVLNLFIWPMWIILAIGLMPLVGLFLNAIGGGDWVSTLIKTALIGSIIVIMLGWVI